MLKIRPILKLAGLLAALICAGLLPAACPGTASPTGDQPYSIRILGDAGQPFAGSYVVMKADGGIQSQEISGTAPRDFRVDGLQVDLVVSKASATGYLEVQILKGRKVVAEGSVTSSFGSVTLTGR